MSFTSATLGVCTVSGTTLTLVAVGTCTINASQAGNGSYAAATTVSNSFSVAAAPLGAELMAGGGFETAPTVAGQFAQGWRGVNGIPATRTSTESHAGTAAAVLTNPGPNGNGSGLVQNSVDDGGQSSIIGLYTGKTVVLTFWAKGTPSETGNVNFSLRYLDAVGNILNPVINTSFQSQINATTWTKITLNGPAIPANISAMFLEMTLATGPIGLTDVGADANGNRIFHDFGQARILIDDVSVRVVP